MPFRSSMLSLQTAPLATQRKKKSTSAHHPRKIQAAAAQVDIIGLRAINPYYLTQ